MKQDRAAQKQAARAKRGLKEGKQQRPPREGKPGREGKTGRPANSAPEPDPVSKSPR